MRFTEELELIQYTTSPDGLGGQNLVPTVIKRVRGVMGALNSTEKLIAHTTIHKEERFIFQHKDRTMAEVQIDAIRRVKTGKEYVVLRQHNNKHTCSYQAERRLPRGN